jgi:hypothetical protein
MTRAAKVALPGARMLAASAGMVDVQVERREGITYLELVIAIPMTPTEASAFMREFRGGAPAPAAPPRKRGRRRTA